MVLLYLQFIHNSSIKCIISMNKKIDIILLIKIFDAFEVIKLACCIVLIVFYCFYVSPVQKYVQSEVQILFVVRILSMYFFKNMRFIFIPLLRPVSDFFRINRIVFFPGEQPIYHSSLQQIHY